MELGETAQCLGCLLCKQEDQMGFNPLSACKCLLPFCKLQPLQRRETLQSKLASETSCIGEL